MRPGCVYTLGFVPVVPPPPSPGGDGLYYWIGCRSGVGLGRTLLSAMRYALLLLASMLAAASPALAQSCATIGDQIDCRRPVPATRAPAHPSAPKRNIEMQGSAETTISNTGASTTLNNRVIDSHGIMEFDFRTSKNKRCGAYQTACD